MKGWDCNWRREIKGCDLGKVDAAAEVALKWWIVQGVTAALLVVAERVRVEAKREMSREVIISRAICELGKCFWV